MEKTNRTERMTDMNFAERLSDARKNAHLTQDQLAERLDVSRQTVSKWEAGGSLR